MSVVTYGFFGEDEGQGVFLRQYLLKLEARHPVRVVAHAWYSKKFKGLNNSGVDKGFREAWLAGFGQAQYRLDCLFVGRDLDASTATVRAERLALLAAKIADIPRDDWRGRTVFILPMQCVEHWLLYLQRRAAGRPSNATRALELLLNDTVKKEVYDSRRIPPTQTKDELVTALAASLDIDWLAEVSASFRDFHGQVTSFLASHPAE